MKINYQISFLLFCAMVVFHQVHAQQFIISGTVYDSTKFIPLQDVMVKAKNGNHSKTDSNGHYSITTAANDSLTFFYNNKATAKFAVNQINNTGIFDISLHVRVAEKFKTLKEVKIFSKNFRQDSIQNREQYASIFKYQRPGISFNTDAYTGAAGLDLNEFINIFRFKRNKQLKKMQERLMEQEKESYINYRFNKATIRRITRLQGKELDAFMLAYRPNFEFTQYSSLVEFYQYILDASYQFKKDLLIQGKTKEYLLGLPKKTTAN